MQEQLFYCTPSLGQSCNSTTLYDIHDIANTVILWQYGGEWMDQLWSGCRLCICNLAQHATWLGRWFFRVSHVKNKPLNRLPQNRWEQIIQMCSAKRTACSWNDRLWRIELPPRTQNPAMNIFLLVIFPRWVQRWYKCLKNVIKIAWGESLFAARALYSPHWRTSWAHIQTEWLQNKTRNLLKNRTCKNFDLSHRRQHLSLEDKNRPTHPLGYFLTVQC